MNDYMHLIAIISFQLYSINIYFVYLEYFKNEHYINSIICAHVKNKRDNRISSLLARQQSYR